VRVTHDQEEALSMADRVGVRAVTGTHGDLSTPLLGDGLPPGTSVKASLPQAPVLVAERR